MNQIPLNQITNKLIIQSAQQTADLSQLTQSFHMNLTAFSLLSFTVGLFHCLQHSRTNLRTTKWSNPSTASTRGSPSKSYYNSDY